MKTMLLCTMALVALFCFGCSSSAADQDDITPSAPPNDDSARTGIESSITQETMQNSEVDAKTDAAVVTDSATVTDSAAGTDTATGTDVAAGNDTMTEADAAAVNDTMTEADAAAVNDGVSADNAITDDDGSSADTDGTSDDGATKETLENWSTIKADTDGTSDDGATPEPTPVLELIPEKEWDTSGVDTSWIDPDKKLVAFTFDDGPTKYYSDILDVLNEYNMHATFFVWGRQYNEGFHDDILRVVESGCELGNHTWSHPYLTKLTPEEIRSEIEQTRELLESLTGIREYLVRPPYGSANADVKENVFFPMINWSLDTADWNNGTYDDVYETLTGRVQDGDIVLMHASYQFTAEAVRDAIPVLIENGYQIVSVSELCAFRGKTLKANSAPLGMRITN